MVRPKVNFCLVYLHLLSSQLQLLLGVYEDWAEHLVGLLVLCKYLHLKYHQPNLRLPATWLNGNCPSKLNSPLARPLSPACPRVPFRWPFCRLYRDCNSKISIRSIATRCISTFSEGYHFNVWLKSSALSIGREKAEQSPDFGDKIFVIKNCQWSSVTIIVSTYT